MMIKPINIIAIIMIFTASYGLFQVKFTVQNLSKDVSELSRLIEEEKESIHVLKAEWSYLNKPERLEKLIRKYTKLDLVSITQLAEINDDFVIDYHDHIRPTPILRNPPKGKKVKWNYKKENSDIIRVHANK